MAPSAIPTFSRSRAASSSSSTDAELQLLQRLETPLKNLSRLAQSFEDVFNHLALTSTAQFLPTPVRVLPNGEETGRFLALDLGGTNLRVGVVELFGEDPPSENGSYDEEDVEEDESAGGGRLRITTQGSWNIPEHLKSDTAERYFAWVAEKMGDVVSGYLDAVGPVVREATLAEGMEVGIAFSFPMEYDTPKLFLIIIFFAPTNPKRPETRDLTLTVSTTDNLPTTLPCSCPWAKALPLLVPTTCLLYCLMPTPPTAAQPPSPYLPSLSSP